jgi:alpha-mannosidase
MSSAFKSPFVVEGAHNVFLETVKLGEDVHSSKSGKASTKHTTVILRLYEAYGGHTQARLRIASHIPVSQAFLTNFLEDETNELNLKRADDSEETAAILCLDFRGFEVKTVKLVVGIPEVGV